MKIVVLSDCRQPTLPIGGHGLGRLCHSLATSLQKRGHQVSLWAGPGSVFDGDLVIHADENERANTVTLNMETRYIDCSHFHQLSQVHPDFKIIDWILDGECQVIPERAYVTTSYCQRYFPAAQIIPVGIDVANIPYFDVPMTPYYLSFAAKIHAYKGFQDALRIHQEQSIPVRFVGKRFVNTPLPDWREELTGAAFYKFVGQSVGLLHPLRQRNALGGGLMPLEAAAMGVPSLVYDDVSTAKHVKHCVSGFVVQDFNELLDAIPDLPLLNRYRIREWVADTHTIDIMCKAVETELEAIDKVSV